MAATPTAATAPDACLARALDLVFRNGSVALVLLDADGRVVHANAAYERLLGRTLEELRRLDVVADLTHPEDRATGLAELAALRRGELESFTVDKRYRRPDGGVLPARVSAIAVRDASGRLAYTAATVRDVTAEHDAERRADDWRRRYEAAVLASRQVVYDWDVSGEATVWGGACETLLGYRLEELGGFEDWLARIHPDDVVAARAAVEDALAARSDIRVTYRFRHGDGSWIWIEDSGFFVVDARGRAERMIGFLVDVTARVEAERDRHRLAVEIGDREQERLGADLHDAVGQDLAAVALLLEDATARARIEAPALAERLAEAEPLLFRAARGLRGLSRSRTGAQPWPGLLVATLAELARDAGTLHGLECEVRETGGPVETGPEVGMHLYRIAQEALTNAAKHGRARRATVTIAARPGGYELEIADDGRGIDVSRARTGEGLGLRLMEYRAQVIGARVEVGPGAGGGTVVRVAGPAPSA